jgi:hypothetical protein
VDVPLLLGVIVLLSPVGKAAEPAREFGREGTSAERTSVAAAVPVSIGEGLAPSLIPRSSRPGVTASAVGSAAGAGIGAIATPGGGLAMAEAILDDNCSICDVHGIVSSVVDGAFASPQLHVFTVVVMGTLGGGTGTVLPTSSMLAVQPQCRTVMMVVAVVMPCSQMSQTSMKMVVMAVGRRIIEAEEVERGGLVMRPLVRLPPPGKRMTVPLLAADMALEPVDEAGDDDAAGTDVDELWLVLEMPTGPTMMLPETVELNTTAELEDTTAPGPGTKSVLL